MNSDETDTPRVSDTGELEAVTLSVVSEGRQVVMTSGESTPGGIRTPNQRIRNPLLYPLSYGGTRTHIAGPCLDTEFWHRVPNTLTPLPSK